MTDLENRLAGALRAAAAEAPHSGGLAAGARSRLRRRRRTTVAGVAGLLVVLAVPAGWWLRPTSSPDVAAVPDGWRVESYSDLTIRVPDSWGYDGGPDWCEGNRRPGVMRVWAWSTDAGCSPRWSYGVSFADGPGFPDEGPRDVPPGAVVGMVASPHAHAWVVAESEDLLEQIAASAQTIDGVDPNGCPAMFDRGVEGSGEQVSVCRYDSGVLQQSELLTALESDELLAAVERTTLLRGTDVDIPCPPDAFEHAVVTMRSATVDVDLLPSSCLVSNVFVADGEQRLVTEDVLFWAWSPGMTVLPSQRSGLPVPDPLRD